MLSSLLARFGSPQAIGIYLEGSQAFACRAASTPLGVVELATRHETIDPDQPQAAIERLVDGMLKRRSEKIPVAIGISADQTFFTTRSLQTRGGDVSPRVLLREALRSSKVAVDQMVVDVVRSQHGSRQMASIVACHRDMVEQIAQPLKDRALPMLRVEPVPCALLRRAVQQGSSHRRAKVVCRVFLSDTHLLAVLTSQDKPLLWRHTRLPRGDESSAILAAVRSLGSIGSQSGLESQLELVVIHGRSDLRRLLDMDWVHEQIAGKLEWLDGPALDGSQIAAGLAEGCLEDLGGFNLARQYHTERTLWQNFPWSEAAIHVGLIFVMTLFLAYRLLLVKDELTSATMRNAQNAIASLSTIELQKEKKELKAQVSAVEEFVGSRIVWTNYERELAKALPRDVFVTSLRGASEFSSKSKSKTKAQKQLVLKCAVAIPQDGLIPHEVDRLLNALRQNPLLQADFPVIELAELKQYKRDDETLAMFTVLGLPKGKKK
jgi:hypothetical protein